MKVKTTPRFDRCIKKLHPQEKESLNNAVKAILSNPIAGEAKKGDLAGVLVYKYKYQQQLLLLAYSIDNPNQQLILLGYGTHENFYRDLKRN